MKKYRYLIILAIIALDQLVKVLVRSNMEPGESIDVIGKIFSITYIQNRGVAFSLLSGSGFVLVVLPAIAVVVCVVVMEVLKDMHWSIASFLILTVSGGIGNIIDRTVLGYVTDMFDFHFWPVFNIADIAIVVGCVMMALYVFKFDKDDEKPTI